MKTTILLLLLLFSFSSDASLLKVSTSRNIMFYMVSSTDHINPATGLTVSCTLSKDSGAFASSGGSVTEIANGWYNLAANTTDTNTKGDLVGHCTGTGADPAEFRDQVVTDLPGDTIATVTGNVNGNVSGSVGSVSGNVGGNVVGSVASVSGNVGGNVVGSVASVTGAVASVTSGVTVSTNNDKTGYSLSTSGIQGIWDRATSNLTTSGSIGLLLTTDIDTNVGSRAPSSTALSTAQWTNGRASNLDNLDATVSSRLASASYSAPPSASSIAGTVWSSLTSGMSTSGSIGLLLSTDVDTNVGSRAPSSTALSTSQWTNTRAGYLDQLNKFIFDGSSFVEADTMVNQDKTGYTLLPASIPIKKNTAFPNFTFPIIGTLTGNPTAGLTVSCQLAIDSGSFTACTNSVADIGTGYYRINFAAADLNGNTIVVRFFGTNVKEKSITFITQ